MTYLKRESIGTDGDKRPQNSVVSSQLNDNDILSVNDTPTIHRFILYNLFRECVVYIPYSADRPAPISSLIFVLLLSCRLSRVTITTNNNATTLLCAHNLSITSTTITFDHPLWPTENEWAEIENSTCRVGRFSQTYSYLLIPWYFVQSKPCSRNYPRFIIHQSKQMTQRFFNTVLNHSILSAK